MGRCPACLSTSGLRQIFRLSKFDVFLCGCGARFIDPSLDGASQMAIYQSSELLAQINPALERYYEYETLDPASSTCRDYDEALNRLKLFSPGTRLLEVGCGAGSFLKFAKLKGWQVHGVDSGMENIRALREEGIEATCSSFLDFQTNHRFDCIVFWDLIEHPQDPGEFIKKCRNLLSPKGLILIAAPLDPNLLSVIASALYHVSAGSLKFALEKLYIAEHTSYFSIPALSKFMNRFHFKTVVAWKSETDLARYAFKSVFRILLKMLFAVARVLGLQNRLMLIAQRQD